MAWTDIRRAARAVVHDTFAEVQARYYATPGMGVGVLISVRVHNKVLVQGDLGREGFAQIMEEIERAILLTSDVDTLNIVTGGAIKLPDERTYLLEVQRPPRDDFTVEWEVRRI